MKTRAIVPAQIDFGAAPGDAPRSREYGDIYHPAIGAVAQARHVFLRGNGLPERWAGRRRFVVLETGFGLGNNFIATWDAWRQDAQRCERLFFVSVERHPPTQSDLERAHAASPLPELATELVRAWPELTPNLHALDFDGGRVQLLLGLGDVADLLPGLRADADAFFLDGFAPARNPQMWQPRVLKALGRKAAPGATLATWSVAREVQDGLAAAGFTVQRAPGIGGKREITVAHWQPRFTPPLLPTCAQPHAREAIVVGAGIAGAAVAQALARLGLAVTVVERHAAPAMEASGNLAGLFHGTVNADDGTYARLYRSAALHARREYGHALDQAATGEGGPRQKQHQGKEQGQMRGQVRGLLRLDRHPGGAPALQRVLQRLGLPPGYVQALSADDATRMAGLPLPAAAWFFPGGGWIAPAEWIAQALSAPGIEVVYGAELQRLTWHQHTGCWQLHSSGGVLASAPIMVLANGASAAGIAAGLASSGAATMPPWPLHHTRGQVSFWQAPGSGAPRIPVAGDGYAIPLPGGGLLCGATSEEGVPGDTSVRDADHLLNVDRLQRLTGLLPPADASQWQGRTAWRVHAADRLPIVGALPDSARPGVHRLDQARLWPRHPGMFTITALGARGLTLAPLLARLVAAQATGTPWPLEQDLADAIDPARFAVRAARAMSRDPGSGGA